MAEHTPQQWRDLHTAVTAMIADPTTPVDKRNRAEDILGIIRRNPQAMQAINEKPTLQDPGWTEFI